VEAILVNTNVQVHNVSFFKRARVGNPVANALVDGSATAPGEVVIIQRRRVCLLADGVFMHDSVDFLGGDTWLDSAVAGVDGSSCDTA